MMTFQTELINPRPCHAARALLCQMSRKADIMFDTKISAEMTAAELAERKNQRAAIRAQIIADQQVNAKRNKKALAREKAWSRKSSPAEAE